MNEMQVTEQDVESLARKLADFTLSLSPGERIAFEIVEQQLVAMSGSEEPEVSGYSFSTYAHLADAHRRELLLRARGQLGEGNRAGFWESLLAALSGTPKERGR
jgi:hypothetical protein